MTGEMRDDGVYEVSVLCQTDQQSSVNHFQIVWTQGEESLFPMPISEVADSIDDLLAPLFKAIMPEEAAYEGVTVRQAKFMLAPFPRTEYAFGNVGVGTFPVSFSIPVNILLPTQVCGLLNLASPDIGLANQGRLFLPFPAMSANQTKGEPSDAYLTACEALGAALITGHLVVSGDNNGTWSACRYNETDGLRHRFDRYWMDKRWATQRRRGSFGQMNRAVHT